MSIAFRFLVVLSGLVIFTGCVITGEVVRVAEVTEDDLSGLSQEELKRIAEIKEAQKSKVSDSGIKNVIRDTQKYTVDSYLAQFPDADNPHAQDYKVGGYDILHITVYEESDLTREGIRVTGDGFISFPLVGRVRVQGLTTSEIGDLLSRKLAEGQYILDAHVSVDIREYKSKQYMVLGAVANPGTYSLEAQERILDAISKAGGVNFDEGAKTGMIIRAVNAGTGKQRKISIGLDFAKLLKGEKPVANLLLHDKDLVYIPEVEYFNIIGEVKSPGSYPYNKNDITLVEAISIAGGFTQIAARNKTRIVRVEDGVEKVITVQVDAITKAGKRGQDVKIEPGDVIVVPESFF